MAVVVGMLVGCSAGDRSSAPVSVANRATSTEALCERAAQYWTARGSESWDDLYPFQPPAIQAETTVDEYRAWATEEEPFRIHDWSIEDCIQQEPFGWVRVRYSATLRRFSDLAPKTATHWQRWVVEGGAWYPVPQRELDQYPETPAMRDAASERRLRSRFDQSWTARLARDWAALYELTDPADREAVSFDEFADSETMFLYLGATVRWTEVIGDRGRIRVSYKHKPADPSMTKLPPQEATIIEHWIRVDGRWFRDLIRERG